MFVYGLFWDEKSAAEAVNEFLAADFRPEDVSAVMRTGSDLQELPLDHKAGVARGAAIGGALGVPGGALGLPAVGWLAAGPLLAALEGAFYRGAPGTLGGALGGLGFWREELAAAHEEHLSKGGALLGVTTPNRIELATELLRKAGADEVHVGTIDQATDEIRVRGRLGDDHHSIDRQLSELANTVEGGDFRDVHQALCKVETQLCGHLEGEERYLFGELEGQHPKEIRKLREEHQGFRRTLDELIIEAELHTLRSTRVEQFVAQLREHAQREERTLYRWADELPGKSKRSMLEYLRGLRARIADGKRSAHVPPHRSAQHAR